MKMRLAALAFLAFLAALPAGSRAEPGESGLSLGVRAAYAVPFGEAGDGSHLSDLTGGAVPVQIDAGYRLDPHLTLGAYLGWGPAFVADGARRALEAQGATDVGGHAEMRLGLQATYRFRPEAHAMPWVGLAAGYEWTRYAAARLPTATGAADAEIGLAGFEGAAQGGLDLRVGSGFSVGPFAALSLGQYRTRLVSLEGSGPAPTVPAASTDSVADRSWHGWLQLGVRGTFEL